MANRIIGLKWEVALIKCNCAVSMYDKAVELIMQREWHLVEGGWDINSAEIKWKLSTHKCTHRDTEQHANCCQSDTGATVPLVVQRNTRVTQIVLDVDYTPFQKCGQVGRKGIMMSLCCLKRPGARKYTDRRQPVGYPLSAGWYPAAWHTASVMLRSLLDIWQCLGCLAVLPTPEALTCCPGSC